MMNLLISGWKSLRLCPDLHLLDTDSIVELRSDTLTCTFVVGLATLGSKTNV
jgi:hypothetical protein